MRNLLMILIIAVALAGCAGSGESGCSFTSAHIIANEVGSNKPLEDKTVTDCFVASAPDQLGLVEIKGDQTADKFKVSYYQDLSMLNVKAGSNLAEWRKNKGHDIMQIGKPGEDSLSFIFGDRKVSKIKGTVTFKK